MESNPYDFASVITTDDGTAQEFEELDNEVDELIEQIEIIEGITLVNSTDIDKQFQKEADEQYSQIMKDSTYDPKLDPEIEHNNGQTKPRLRGKRFDKEYIKRLVSQCDLFGLSRTEACEYINRVLNPDKLDNVPEFTVTMYNSWLGKLKEHKILFFEYYSRSGIFEDVYDTRATIKLVFQNLARQFRTELLKGKDKDKIYIIKLAQTIDTMSETMMRVSMSSPFIAGFKSLMDNKNLIIDEIKRKHPSIFADLDIDSLGSKLSLPSEVRSSPDGESRHEEGHAQGSILERLTTQEEGAGTGEGNIPESTVTRRIQETDGTARKSLTERVF